MNPITTVTAMLLGTLMLAGPALATDITKAGFCKRFDSRLWRLCAKHDASCDRILAGFKDVCLGSGKIYASPSAESLALDLLRKDHDVVTVDKDFPVQIEAAAVVVTAADLDDPTLARLLIFARHAGRTIAIVDATQEEVDRFASRFGGGVAGANCAPSGGTAKIELYGLQETITRTPAVSSSYCLVGLDRLDRAGEVSVRHWLRERFKESSPEPTAGQPLTTISDDSTNIVDLATKTHCSISDSNDPTGQKRQLIQDVYVTGARSFRNAQDIYYVQNELQYTQGTSTDPNYGYAALRFGAIGVPDFAGGLSQPQPATVTTFQSGYSNTSTETLSGSIGFNGLSPTGTIGGSVSQGQTTNFTVPATTVLNDSVNPLPSWTFQRQDTQGQDYSPQTSWLWTVDWNAYADQGIGGSGRMQFVSELSMSTDFVSEQPCSVPYPFEGITTVGEPVLTSVQPSKVQPGLPFTITGANLYQGLVDAVLLNGDSVGDANFTTNGETAPGSGIFTITVIVPGAQPTDNTSVVVKQTFNSQSHFSNAGSIEITTR